MTILDTLIAKDIERGCRGVHVHVHVKGKGFVWCYEPKAEVLIVI